MPTSNPRRKTCPKGYHLTQPRCIKDNDTSKRNIKKQEARRIVEILDELRPQIIPATSEPYAIKHIDERLHEDAMRLTFDLDTEMISEAYFRMPLFFLYALPRMAEPAKRTAYPDPDARYKHLEERFLRDTEVSHIPLAYKYVVLKSYLITYVKVKSTS